LGRYVYIHILLTYTRYTEPKPVSMADVSFMYAEGVGSVKVRALIDKLWRPIVIEEAEFIPGGMHLFSENVLLSKGCSVQKSPSGDIVYYRRGKRDVEARRKDGLQIMQFKPIVNKACAAMASAYQDNWHERLGHINNDFIKKTAEKRAVFGLDNITMDNSKCEICIRAKSKRQSYPSVDRRDDRAYLPGECLHADLVHSTVTSTRGNKYFLVVKDEASSIRQVYFQDTKEKTPHNLMDAVNFLSNQTQ